MHFLTDSHMKYLHLLLLISLSVVSCNNPEPSVEQKTEMNGLIGTWKLFNATLVEKGDTTVTDYTKDISFIKVINPTHFAFLRHSVNSKDSLRVFSAGGGRYTLRDSLYTEQLEYCSAPEWEGHDFSFNIRISNDTLIQSGVEKIESAGINRLNIEKYVRVKE
jgi:hypothetical protein